MCFISMYSVLSKLTKYIYCYNQKTYLIHFCCFFLKSSKALSALLKLFYEMIYLVLKKNILWHITQKLTGVYQWSLSQWLEGVACFRVGIRVELWYACLWVFSFLSFFCFLFVNFVSGIDWCVAMEEDNMFLTRCVILQRQRLGS